jgi:streptogramin lyase
MVDVSRTSRTLCFAFIGAFVIMFAVPSAIAQQGDISIKEWDVPTPNSDPHDIVVDGNGLVWYTAIGANKIGPYSASTSQVTE